MALLDEQIVEEWLNRKHFFTMRGIKCGVDEIDLLAFRNIDGIAEYWHVEVQVSFRPVGYIGGDTNARRRTEGEIRTGVDQWVKKKFTSDRKCEKRIKITHNENWRYVFVYGVVKDERELEFMKEYGVDLVPYKEIITFLRDNTTHQSSSVASNIAEILKHFYGKQ